MKRIILLLVYTALLIPVMNKHVHAQAGTDKVEFSKRVWRFGGEAGYVWQYTNSFDAIFNIMSYRNTDPTTANRVTPCFGAGIGFNYHHIGASNIPNPVTFNPTARIEHYTRYTRAALNFTTFFRNKSPDLRLTPEIGYVRNGMFSLNYGYNIPLNNNELAHLNRHRISLNVNITIGRFILIEMKEGTKKFFRAFKKR